VGPPLTCPNFLFFWLVARGPSIDLSKFLFFFLLFFWLVARGPSTHLSKFLLFYLAFCSWALHRLGAFFACSWALHRLLVLVFCLLVGPPLTLGGSYLFIYFFFRLARGPSTKIPMVLLARGPSSHGQAGCSWALRLGRSLLLGPCQSFPPCFPIPSLPNQRLSSLLEEAPPFSFCLLVGPPH
jgi:hypothetical protein